MSLNNPDMIAPLNAILRHMLTGINQFFLHARVLKHRGDLKLADFTYRSSIDAMKFSDMLVEQILQLGGMPNMQDMGTLAIGQTPEAMLGNDLKHVEAGLVLLRNAVENATQKHTAELLKRIADNQQEQASAIAALLLHFAPQQPIKDCA